MYYNVHWDVTCIWLELEKKHQCKVILQGIFTFLKIILTTVDFYRITSVYFILTSMYIKC